MSTSKISNAYGFQPISKASNNITTVQQQRTEQNKVQAPAASDIVQGTADAILDIIKQQVLSVSESSLYGPELQKFSTQRATQMAYLRTLEAYLQNQLFQVRQGIEALSKEDLE